MSKVIFASVSAALMLCIVAVAQHAQAADVLFVADGYYQQETDIFNRLQSNGHDVTIEESYNVTGATDLTPYNLIIVTEYATGIDQSGIDNIDSAGKPLLIIEYWDFYYSYAFDMSWDSWGDYLGTDTVHNPYDNHFITEPFEDTLDIHTMPWAVLTDVHISALKSGVAPLIYSDQYLQNVTVAVDDANKRVFSGICDTNHFTEEAWDLFDQIVGYLFSLDCTPEGLATYDEESCCDNLSVTPGCIPGEECDPIFYYCTACGDDVCGPHENPWTCGLDCSDCTSSGLDDESCARATVQFWADLERMRVAEDLAGMTYEDRAAAISEQTWFGRMPGTVSTAFYHDGALRKIVGTKVSPRLFFSSDTHTGPVAYSNAFVSRYGPMLFWNAPEIELVQYYKQITSTGEHVVFYRQLFDGVPVVGGMLFIVFDNEHRLTAVHNTILPSLSHITVPNISLEEAEDAIGAFLGGIEVEAQKSGVFIYPGAENRLDSRLVYEIEAIEYDTEQSLGAFRVDAFSGDVVARHPVKWSFPYIPGAIPIVGNPEPYARFFDGKVPYEVAYCFEAAGADGSCAGDTLISHNRNNYSKSQLGRGSSAADETNMVFNNLPGLKSYDSWNTDASAGDRAHWYPIYYMFENHIIPDFEQYNSDDTVSGREAGIVGLYYGDGDDRNDPFSLATRTRFPHESIAYSVSPGSGWAGIFSVEGVDLFTFAHEFGHRIHQWDLINSQDHVVWESIGDINGLVYTQIHKHDPDSTRMPCKDSNGDDAQWDLSRGSSCFTVSGKDTPGEGDGDYYHETIKVSRDREYTRCSAIEKLARGELDPQDADLDENMWRSFKEPTAKNHGHGRSPATYDQLINDDSMFFEEDLMSNFTPETMGDTLDIEAFCEHKDDGDNEGRCKCGGSHGIGHTNQGILNKFFFDLAYISGANYTLANTAHDTAYAMQDLMFAIYGEGVFATNGSFNYPEVAERILEVVDEEVNFNSYKKKMVKEALRDRKIFMSAGGNSTVSNGTPSDIEAVWHWRNIDDQRLYIFYRMNEDSTYGTDPWMLDHPERYPRPLGYAVLQMVDNGATRKWSIEKQCRNKMPMVDGEIARSGFAPTAVNLGDSIFVAWSQYDKPLDEAGKRNGKPWGHLAYARFDPLDGDDGCGAWSDVNIDTETEVHGSVRSTFVDRDSIYFAILPDFETDPCWLGPLCDPVDRDIWDEVIDPIDSDMSDLLDEAGFEPDIPMDQVWDDAPGDDSERSNFGHAFWAILAILQEQGLGLLTLPMAGDQYAPYSASRVVSLRVRDLNQALNISTGAFPEISDSMSVLLPNAMQFITQTQKASIPMPLAMKFRLVQGTHALTGDNVFSLDVQTVAVAFLNGDEDTAGRRDVTIRQYATEGSVYGLFDAVVGKASYTPALTTLGRHEQSSQLYSQYQDRVVACTDFAEAQQGPVSNQMACKVFDKGVITAGSGALKKIGLPYENVDPDVALVASPRAVNIADSAYIFYRSAGSDSLKYVAFEGVDFDVVTYNPIFYGLEFKDTWNGPDKVVTHVNVDVDRLPDQPSKAGEDWPVFAATPFVNSNGALGFLGVEYGGGVFDTIEYHIRGLEAEY